MKNVTKIILILILLTVSCFAEPSRNLHVPYDKDAVCAAWFPHLGGDMSIVQYHKAGCPAPVLDPELEVIDLLGLADIPVTNQNACEAWYWSGANYEDEIADWSQVCGIPRAEGGCDIWMDEEEGLTVEGVCN